MRHALPRPTLIKAKCRKRPHRSYAALKSLYTIENSLNLLFKLILIQKFKKKSSLKTITDVWKFLLRNLVLSWSYFYYLISL